MTIFISYAHADEEDIKGFFSQIKGLRATEVELQVLSDQDIPDGSPWESWINEKIEEAEGGILLISPNFLDSRWCQNEAAALRRRLGDDNRVLWVWVRHFPWWRVDWLEAYNPLNQRPVISKDGDPDKTWSEIVDKILEVQQGWSAKPQTDPGAGKTEEAISLRTLQDALTDGGGGVAFFLGPGIHERQGDMPAAEHLRARLDLLTEHLVDEGPSHYARTIVEEKLPGALDRPSLVERPDESWREDLVAFQASLARVGSAASGLVAKTLYRRHMALANIGSLEISLQNSDETPEEVEERIELRNLFFAACERAAALDRSRDLPEDIGLGMRGIFEQIMALTYVAFGRDVESSDPECKQWYDLFHKQIWAESGTKIVQLRPGRAERFLALAHLEWLGDLLWHTLRFDTPLYPSPNDLAFQLSVCATPFTPPRREKIGTIASLALPTLVDKVKAWLEKSGTVPQHDAYRAVARGLCDAWIRRQKSAEHSAGAPPLAVTTNFDNELEQILCTAQISHHILFPVHSVRRSSQVHGSSMPPEERQDWILYTEVWPEGETHPVRSWEVLRRDGLENFHGPLLVKLYGSPMTKITEELVQVDGKQNYGRRWEFSHRLIVSDLDLLALMAKEWWPAGLANLLFGQPNRLICFLGYSPADVESRLRLFEHVRQYEMSQEKAGPGGKSSPTKGPVVVMSPPEDPVYRKYLTNLKTQVLLEDLDKICMMIQKHCACEALDQPGDPT